MINGFVIHGDGIGKKLGFPTANLDIKKESCSLASGIYAGKTCLNKKEYFAALVIQEKVWKVEVYLLDYEGEDFYGDYLSVEIIEKVGELEDFKGSDNLIKKIGDEVDKVKEVFNLK